MINKINDLEFKYFTIEELETFKQFIENRIDSVKNGKEVIEEKVLKYFAGIDVMYGDGDLYIDEIVEISFEEYIKLKKCMNFVYVRFFNEFMGEPEGDINEFVSLHTSFVDISTDSSCDELETCLEEIDTIMEDLDISEIDLESPIIEKLFQDEEELDEKELQSIFSWIEFEITKNFKEITNEYIYYNNLSSDYIDAEGWFINKTIHTLLTHYKNKYIDNNIELNSIVLIINCNESLIQIKIEQINTNNEGEIIETLELLHEFKLNDLHSQ